MRKEEKSAEDLAGIRARIRHVLVLATQNSHSVGSC